MKTDLLWPLVKTWNQRQSRKNRIKSTLSVLINWPNARGGPGALCWGKSKNINNKQISILKILFICCLQSKFKDDLTEINWRNSSVLHKHYSDVDKQQLHPDDTQYKNLMFLFGVAVILTEQTVVQIISRILNTKTYLLF